MFDTHSALQSRIRNDLPVLLNRETSAADSQEDRNIREHDSDGQPSDVGLHAQARSQATEEEQHATLQSPNEQSVAVPRQQFKLAANDNIVNLLVCHCHELLLRKVDIGAQEVRPVDRDGIANITKENQNCDVIIAAEVSEAYCSSANSETGQEDSSA